MATKTTAAAKKTGTKSSGKSDASGHGSHVSADHEEIRKWAEERGGAPACVRGTGDKNDTGVIRIDFPTGDEPKLQQISWDEWFEKFDANHLALIYQSHTAGGEVSRFNKIVSRDTVEEKSKGKSGKAGGH